MNRIGPKPAIKRISLELRANPHQKKCTKRVDNNRYPSKMAQTIVVIEQEQL